MTERNDDFEPTEHLHDDATEASDYDQLFRRDPDATQVMSQTDGWQQEGVPGGDPLAGATSADHLAEADQARRDEEERLQREAAERRAEELRREEELRRQEEEARARAEERAARERALGAIPRSDEELEPEPTPIQLRTTDYFSGSLALFLLRLVTAAIFGIRGFQKLTDIQATVDLFANQLKLPSAEPLAWGVAIAEVVIAVMLVFGLGTRIAGALAATLAILSLSFIRWGNFNPFMETGFSGELELLLAVVGILLLLIGSGGWGVDANWRKNRLRARAGY